MANSCHKHSQLCCVKENPDEGSDAPSTLERSGSERRVGAVNIPVSIRSTPYCKSQNNVVSLHGGIIILILKQEYEV